MAAAGAVTARQWCGACRGNTRHFLHPLFGTVECASCHLVSVDSGAIMDRIVSVLRDCYEGSFIERMNSLTPRLEDVETMQTLLNRLNRDAIAYRQLGTTRQSLVNNPASCSRVESIGVVNTERINDE